MTHFLEKILSTKRYTTYVELSQREGETRAPHDLYALNMAYSKELYIMLGGLEVAIRNQFNKAIVKAYKKEDWFSLDIFEKKHKKQINDATDYVARMKKNAYTFDDIIAHLNYGFWVNLCNRPYEKELWIRALYKCFPYLGQKPNRDDIRRRLSRTHTLRNKIAHLEPIIKNEELLIQEYRNASELLYSISPDTQEWFQTICNFEEIWHNRNKQNTREKLK